MSCIDTLRLSASEQAELLRQLEGTGSGPGAELRQHARVLYRPAAGIVVSLDHPGGSRGLFLVRPRNLSTGGIGFLHGGYLHRESRCGLALRTPDGGAHTLVGQVAWCRHVRRHVHEVGVAFQEPIELREFVNTCVRTALDDAAASGAGAGAAEADARATTADAAGDVVGDAAATSTPMPELRGRVLYVEDAVDERELVRFQLGQLGVEVRVVADAIDALDQLERERFDLVLTGIWLPGVTGLELIDQVAQMRPAPPVLALTADPNRQMHADAVERGAAGVLVKPYTFQALVEAVERHLPAAAGEGGVDRPVLSEHWSNPAMRPLILRYLDRAAQQAEELQRLGAGPDQHVARKLALDIKGAAGNYGYPALSDAARRLYELLEGNAGVDELHDAQAAVRRLIAAARAAAHGGAGARA